MKKYIIFLIMHGTCLATTSVVPARPLVGHVGTSESYAAMQCKDNAPHIGAVERSYQQRQAYKQYKKPRTDKDEPMGKNY